MRASALKAGKSGKTMKIGGASVSFYMSMRFFTRAFPGCFPGLQSGGHSVMPCNAV